jgi:hypothetical protein
MATKDEVISQIRFGLSQLSAKNAHHEFEHLCRHFARSTICKNILPATGPVQAGGDQGRDFETFHTYLKHSSIADSSFVGFSDKPIAFACSLEKSPERKNRKIQSDVTTIVSSGVPVDRIYFFSSEDIIVSKRHELIQWAEDTYGVNLEIIDAQAISELLAEPEVFWIANRYLSIPSEIYPRPVSEADWYKALLEEYKKKETIHLTFEEFHEIKIAGRHIYKSSDLKQDLPFWIEKLEHFISDHVFPRIKREAMYEVFVLSIVGLGNATGREDLVREYFSYLDELFDTSELEDATCLLSFANTAVRSHQLVLEQGELNSWQEQLRVNLEEGLANTEDPNRICSLLEIQSQFINVAPKEISDLQRNFKTQINLLQRFLDHIPYAPFYPLERLSYKLTRYIEQYLELHIPVDLKELEEIAEIVDEFLAKRIGSFEVAKRLGNRAVLYLENNQMLRAIKIFHKAKVKYFADEALEGSILMMLFLADSYGRLKMNIAGKYYALVAFHVAINSGKLELSKYIPQAVCNATRLDYKNGSWISFFDLIGPTLLLGSFTLKDYIEKHPQVDEIIYQLTIIKYITEQLTLDLQHLINFQVGKWHFLREYIEILSEDMKKNFDPMSSKELWQSFEDQLDYKPFNDVGKTRLISWEVFGIIWEIEFTNDYLTNAIAEQFMAVLQILLIELADTDLYLIKGTVKIKLIRVEDETPSFKQNPSNKERLWEVRLPSLDENNREAMGELQKHYIAFASAILYELSLLPSKTYQQIIEESFKEDLLSKIAFVLPYQLLYRKYISEEKFNESQRERFTNPFENKVFNLSCKESFQWKDGIAPIYNHNKSLERISNRYKNSIEPIEITLKQLNQLPEFQKTVEYFRKKGWRDWHILMTIMNVALNYKVQKNTGITNLFTNPHEYHEEFMRLSQLPEKDNYIYLPPQIFSRENIEWQFGLAILSVLSSYGLESHSETPNIEAIQELLGKRFNFLTDDVEHEDYFKI